MSKLNFTLLILFFLCNILRSQTNFKDGYLITNNFDTLVGQIDNRNYFENSQYCKFKFAGKDSIVTYNPYQLFGYRFHESKFYISKLVNNQKVFVEYLINGNLDIYFLQDSEHNNHYYVANDSTGLHEIIYKEGIKNVNGKDVYYENKPFIGTLNYFTKDYPEFRKDISAIKQPNHKNLIHLAEKYHNLTCDSINCIIYEKKIHRNIKVNLSGGYSSFYPGITEFERGTYPNFGFNFLIQQTQRNESIYLGLGAFYEGNCMLIDSSKNNYIRIPISITYNNPRLGFSPVYSYQIDVYPSVTSQALEAGIKYQMKHMAVFMAANIKTTLLVIPYAYSVSLGLSFNLNTE